MCRGGRAMRIIKENENSLITSRERNFRLFLQLLSRVVRLWILRNLWSKRDCCEFTSSFHRKIPSISRCNLFGYKLFAATIVSNLNKLTPREKKKTLSISNDLKQIALKTTFFPTWSYLNQFSWILLLISLFYECETRRWSKRQIIKSRCAIFCMPFSTRFLLNSREVQKLSTTQTPNGKILKLFWNYAVRNINQFH